MTKSRIMGRMEGIEAANKDDDTMGDLSYCKRNGSSTKVRKGIAFTLRYQT